MYDKISFKKYVSNCTSNFVQENDGGNRYRDGIQGRKWSQPVGTKSSWRAGVRQGMDQSILQGGGVPLSFKA